MGLTRVMWIATAAALVLYLVMMLWSLPRLTEAAGGAQPFDLRPFGYDVGSARDFLDRLGAEGARFYTQVQLPLAHAFPLLLAVALGAALGALAPEGVRFLPVLAAPVAIAGWLEAGAVGRLLQAGADGLTRAQVAAASRWSVLESASVTLAVLVLAALLAARIWTQFRD